MQSPSQCPSRCISIFSQNTFQVRGNDALPESQKVSRHCFQVFHAKVFLSALRHDAFRAAFEVIACGVQDRLPDVRFGIHAGHPAAGAGSDTRQILSSRAASTSLSPIKTIYKQFFLCSDMGRKRSDLISVSSNILLVSFHRGHLTRNPSHHRISQPTGRATFAQFFAEFSPHFGDSPANLEAKKTLPCPTNSLQT